MLHWTKLPIQTNKKGDVNKNEQFINKVLPVALKLDIKVFGND